MTAEGPAEALARVDADLRERNMRLRIYDCYRPTRAVAQCGRELLGQPGGVDHHVLDAERREFFEVPFDQALAANGE